MVFKVEPGTRDSRLGASFYCENPECMHREWGGGPSPAAPDAAQTFDWKIKEYESRKTPTTVQITPQIALGDLIDAWMLRDTGTGKPYDAILNVSQKTYTPPQDVEYVQIALTEYGSKPGKRNRRDRDFAAAVEQLERWVAEGKHIFVHCVAGANRSASVIMAYLMDQGLDFVSALNAVREKRPIAWPHGEISLTLRRFAQERGSAKTSAKMVRAASEAAEFVAEVDWNEPFEINYLRIEDSSKPLAKADNAQEFFEPAHPASERFIRADLLISQAIGYEHYRAQQYPEAPPTGQTVNVMAAAKPKRKPDLYSRPMFETGRPEILPFEMNPREDIKRLDPATAYTQVLSRRGLKVPAPEVFGSERYQQVYARAPLIPLDPRDPRSLDRAIAFVHQTRGVLIESNEEEKPQEYFRVPTKFGSKRIDHIMNATWFAMFSPNTAVESEETSFVLWQAGASGKDPGKPGIMCKKDKIIYWLGFLKWAGFPRFNQLYKTLEGFDTSDESYERRMIALTRVPGIQFKVASFMLALLGDTCSPTLDMHALGYLMETGKLDVPGGREWYSLSELAQEANELERMYKQSEETGDFKLKMAYTERKTEYDKRAENNKKIIMQLTGQMRIQKEEPPTERGRETERRKVREYIRRQMEGWNGDTETFWAWYAKNEYFKTHEPRRSMIHTVFFQSLFPELFTPEALEQRKMVQEMGDPEMRTEEQEDRAKYRDYLENLHEMRDIQRPFMTKDKTKLKSVPKAKPMKPVAPPPAEDDFDWETGT
jgi:hypothetical protein